MTPEQLPDYLSYLLRLWRVEGTGADTVWCASLEDPRQCQQQVFASPDELFDYLRAQMGLVPAGFPGGEGQVGKDG